MKLKHLALAAVAATTVTATSAMAADGDAKKGEMVFKRCMACHTIKKGGPNRVGPNLWGAVGRKCGGKEDFNYSPAYMDACKDSPWTWDNDAIFAYLPDPSGFLSEKAGKKVMSRMTFKLPKEQERHDVIAYMDEHSDDAKAE